MAKVIYYVVSKDLNYGNGIVVADLEELKKRLLASKPEGDWHLVISIHGAQEVISTEGGSLK
jgi:hypothetical protein